MSLVSNLLTYVNRVATEFRSIRTMITGSATGDLTSLSTTATDLVGAINEVKTTADSTASSSVDATYVNGQISTAIDGLVDSAPGTLDTLNELAAALGDDPNFAATVTSGLASKANSADVYTKTEIGDPTTDFVAAFNTALSA